MNYYIKIVLVLCACLALTSAQFGYNSGYDFFGYNTQSAGPRDPRANTGPVLFPPSPPGGGPSETSGVVAGASGYGFVHPGAGAVSGRSLPRYFYRGFFLR
ncbi:hypothetical protein K1T71_008888 [Dendrolimus kikuchii]|uniref:Uncharacterized protein n=1 Tax=Dendrolimus kikuchii TaxID=765133 RepID=A0ACC1CVK5_9NEOP|nr:hypothetical protein K1T71_008888 [Dendrolimus kikuchii]